MTRKLIRHCVQLYWHMLREGVQWNLPIVDAFGIVIHNRQVLFINRFFNREVHSTVERKDINFTCSI